MCPCFGLHSTPGTPHAAGTPTAASLAYRCAMPRYTPELVLRFSKAQLDGAGACEYPPEFFVELIFSPVDSSGDASSGEFPQHCCMAATCVSPATEHYARSP